MHNDILVLHKKCDEVVEHTFKYFNLLSNRLKIRNHILSIYVVITILLIYRTFCQFTLSVR